MSPHPDLRPLLGEAEPAVGERRRLLDHLGGCPACRAELAAADPSLLFSLLSAETVPEGVLERVSAGVAAALAGEKRRRPVIPGWALAALAASVLVAGVFGAYLSSRPGVEPPPPLPLKVVETEAEPSVPEAGIPAGMFEVLDSPGDADVVEMSVGDVEVVMIFDEAMKI